MGNEWVGLINSFATKYGLDPRLVKAIVMVESGGQTWRTRFEPEYSYFFAIAVYASSLGISLSTEKNHQQTSWGLMQVMGAVAREYGFSGYPPMLCKEEFGLEYGCKLLAKLISKYPDMNDAIASYNAGSPRKTASGAYENQSYVDRVLQEMNK